MMKLKVSGNPSLGKGEQGSTHNDPTKVWLLSVLYQLITVGNKLVFEIEA